MERVIANQMLSYLRAHNLISKHQHGFLSKHSTVSNLLESVNDWTLAYLFCVVSINSGHLDCPVGGNILVRIPGRANMKAC